MQRALSCRGRGWWCAVALLLVWPAVSRADDASAPAPLDVQAAQREAETAYAAAHPEVQEYVLHTARSFGRSGLWLNEQAFVDWDEDRQSERVDDLARLLEEGEYGRHLCRGLAEASALVDDRLVPGLMKVAAFHREDRDYDCRPKWMAVAALARQGSAEAVPLLVGLTDHGNQNTRMWAQAALSRYSGEDFAADKPAWASWWVEQGHEPIDPRYLRPYVPPTP
ncbi:MAG: HEAT repeat domain-containing protein [Planctomycetota bacterium]